MTNLHQRYRQLRRDLRPAPAHLCLSWARSSQALDDRQTATGFHWQEDRQYRRFARWEERGFELRASMPTDENGWWHDGVFTYGEFSARWQPGAVSHWRGGRRDCQWFIPLNTECAKQDYNRACAYGHDWVYVGLVVVARRAGIALGEASLWGIESDCGDERVSEIAFDLADQAIDQARNALKQLCGSR